MGITGQFFAKHIRPLGIDASKAICINDGPGSVSDWLRNEGLTLEEIGNLMASWADLALLPTTQPMNFKRFCTAAKDTASARWNELGQTQGSTVMYLQLHQINELATRASSARGSEFKWEALEGISLAITVTPNRECRFFTNVEGAVLRSDEQGYCYHFERLVVRRASR